VTLNLTCCLSSPPPNLEYYWRINRITDPDEDARFEDKCGPLVLVFMIIVVCSVAIIISINRFSWSHYHMLDRKAGGGGSSTTFAQAPLAQPQQQQQQQQPQQLQLQQPSSGFGGPRSTLMIMQTNDTAGSMAPLWGVVVFCCCMSMAIVITSRSPVLIEWRRRLRHQLQGVRAGDDEDDGLMGSEGTASWGKAKGEAGGAAGYGSAAAGYGTAMASDVPAFETAGPPRAAAAVSVSGGGFRRVPHADALQQRWDQMVATMMPDGRARLRTSSIPFTIV
jgi:hypothetical protein